MDKYTYIANAHGDYIDQLYKAYQQDPESVDAGWRKFFEGFEFATAYGENGHEASVGTITAPAKGAAAGVSDKEVAVRNLIHAYRTRGHLRSNTNPVRARKDRKARLDLSDFGLTDADLDTVFQVGDVIGIGAATLRDIEAALKKIYAGPIGFEYMYIRDPEVLEWFKQKVERDSLNFNPGIEYKKRILSKLNEAVVFENFLHTKFLGQKRFSLEGGETTIPALDAAIDKASELGVEEVVIGMAHRGRLNVLANIMGKTYEQIFSEFEGTAVPDLTMGDGDVKYHMGFSSEVITPSGNKVNLKLAPNPSHLEAVNPVVEGFVRAKIDCMYGKDIDKVLPILIHGDAALAGQGIVYEVTQMANLEGYNTGGTIHFVINNQVGFTTDFEDARSSIYSTDVAKVIDAPVLHVNGDDPEAVVFAMRLAMEYRQRYNNDIFIDMVCYRRHGHNESDEPKFTQPQLYNLISKHPNPREVYNKDLITRGEIDAELAESMDKEFRQMLQDRLDMVKQKPLPYNYQQMEKEWQSLRRSTPEDFNQSPETGISPEAVETVGKALTTLPQGFKPLKQIEKLLKERREMFFESKQLNWAAGELLAYGSVLLDGRIVRFSGQDVQRGTFSHRHAVLHDAVTSAPYNSLDYMKEGQGSFEIYNSLLSEYGVLGFEFGYAMANPNALVIWEAQFGDFANGAQVMIDQFISSTESKWQRMNGLVMLLPHGYEGQGPEHSNARPERFLQLAAENNMFVTYITTPANLFHFMRRQLALPFRKPAINMSPKSLLRHPAVVSPVEDFTSGSFREVIGDNFATPKSVKKVLLCSGKVYFDLLEEQQKNKRKDVAIIRLEQLAPFPKVQLEAELGKYKNAKVYWVQEEPENMGAWTYILRIMRNSVEDVIARKASASPATGYLKVHAKEQQELIARAFAI
ncbi:2-oxoglutarate dehydrogenase E1 component [Pontibacter sp. BT310]|uniref:oxoglutarate dehydrogenase (succinyl-transferring) n=1 Tax=Pontibacter populi TaxID=890055 RepID=A0ABS6XG49_9BACT|nr:MULTISPECIES: 2-oxoglutarate dehydrogenase E1 component [Pontibacter]MBJ6120117.1 2-oxoglutarate dehydrogenase E1 component [Pontibacter sp. BT310]MBR0572550.1 2-oxoglutarate dehydrogenase E1 component [Microvirga sp. STS03]MBW3366970.1 2-oxoglutarate dehydrogenase E1 component [Pontibacter populi]